MNSFERPVEVKSEKANRGWWVHVVWGVALCGALAGNYLLYSKSERQAGELSQIQQASKAQAMRLNEIASMLEESRVRIESLGQEFTGAHQSTTAALAKARNEARRASADLAKTFEEKITEQKSAVATEISAIKETADSKFNAVSTDVNGVKTDLASTKEGLQKTDSDLRRAVGDMGVMSGLIATNSKELAALRELGERNYYEFKLVKNGATKVGDLRLTLKKADVKRNRYTLEVMADDKLVEKRDKTVNEPVQLYRSGARIPYEIVINEVKKNEVAGYLATPKVSMARR